MGMKMTTRIAALTITLSASMLLAGGAAFASASMLQEGESVVGIDLSYSASNQQWDANRNLISSVCKARNSKATLTYEHGYSYFHTIFANVAVAHKKCGETNLGVQVPGFPPTRLASGSATGLGDAEIGVRTRFNNFRNNASWEAFLVVPLGYDTASPSRLGSGSLGLGLGVIWSSYDKVFGSKSWGWKVGSRFIYTFSGRPNRWNSFGEISYAFTETDFQYTGNYLSLRNLYNVTVGGSQGGAFGLINQAPGSISGSVNDSISLIYTHDFKNGYTISPRITKALFGRNSTNFLSIGVNLRYRWRD